MNSKRSRSRSRSKARRSRSKSRQRSKTPILDMDGIPERLVLTRQFANIFRPIDYDSLWENRNRSDKNYENAIETFISCRTFNFNKLEDTKNRKEVQLYRTIYRALKNIINKKRVKTAVRVSQIPDIYGDIIYKMLKNIDI